MNPPQIAWQNFDFRPWIEGASVSKINTEPFHGFPPGSIRVEKPKCVEVTPGVFEVELRLTTVPSPI